MKKIVSGNEAAALAALSMGVKVVAGYPGTPSSEVIASLLKMKNLEGTYVEWSTSEKVATEIAGAASWAGKRAMCTMKMSGLNVAYDSLCGIAYSGAVGGMVVYVCDDPGVTTGMVEQDIRGFAAMTDMVVLEPANVQETYDLVKYAFELSERIGYPVFVRSVTNVAQSHAPLVFEDRVSSSDEPPCFKKDIAKYTKAGAVICMDQHRGIIAGLSKAQDILHEDCLNELCLAAIQGGVGLITAGVSNSFVGEAEKFARAQGFGGELSTLRVRSSIPYPVKEMQELIAHCETIVVAEENETYLERELYIQAYKMNAKVKIIGKLDDTLSRIGAFDALLIAKALLAAEGKTVPADLENFGMDSRTMSAPRPITTCAGCPHRGTFMAINKAIRNLKYKREEVIVTGDIGCTILGMNPPFDTLWTEISMGASVPIAQGFKCAGIDKPVIATMGDSTFFLGGFPGLVNAIQHNARITFVLMDNSWTGMTGMQVNPSTPQEFQQEGCKYIDLVGVIRGLGIEPAVVDPYDQSATTLAMERAIKGEGVQVVIARRECVMPANRRGVNHGKVYVDSGKCNLCKLCVSVTGCPALDLSENGLSIDSSQCNGCGLCVGICTKSALVKEA